MVVRRTKIVGYAGDDKYRLTIPKDMLIGLGWLKQEIRAVGANEKSKERKEEIPISLIAHPFKNYLIISNEESEVEGETKYIIITKQGSIEKGFFMKRKVLHTKLKTAPEAYRRRMEQRLDKWREVQKNSGILKNFYKRLKKDTIVKVVNGKQVRLSKKERNTMLEEMRNYIKIFFVI